MGRIAFDDKKCVWCRSCELICSLRHDDQCSPALARVRIFPNLFEAEVKGHVCRQCEEPRCLQACPVQAIRINADAGVPMISERECIGCGSCAEACPYNTEGTIIFRHPSRNVYVKCDLCSGSPQCIAICPSGALEYMLGK